MSLTSVRYFLFRIWFFVWQRVFAILSFLLLDNRTGSRLRARLLKLSGATIGQHCVIRHGFFAQETFHLTLGDHVYINSNCYFDLSAPIEIGSNVQVAFQTTFITGGHHIGPHGFRSGKHKTAPIVVKQGAWIGARAVIMPGVTIGEGVVVAAGSVVTKDVATDALVAGVPARVMRRLPAEGLANNTEPNLLGVMVRQSWRKIREQRERLSPK